MSDRTEGAGVTAGALTIHMGGQPYAVRPLTIEHSEAWYVLMGKLGAGWEVDDTLAPAEMMASLMAAGSRTAIEALRAYDVDGALGGAENMRRHMTPVELRTALEVVMAAAVPFDVDASRSVALAFGGPTRTLAATMAMTLLEMSPRPRTRESSTPGPSAPGASATTSSDRPGPPSSSSSDGSTDTTSSATDPSPAGTRSRTA